MSKICIFGIVELINTSLYAVQYDNETDHEFKRIFSLWRNPEYLMNFFEENKKDLESGFWGSITIEEAIILTRKEANKLEKEIVEIAEYGKTDRTNDLSSLFKPLYNNATKIDSFEKNKVKGVNIPSWLRMYAIRIDTNLFLITGGAIKLTPTMNEREHLLQELHKLDSVKRFLQDNSNADDFEIFQLFL